MAKQWFQIIYASSTTNKIQSEYQGIPFLFFKLKCGNFLSPPHNCLRPSSELVGTFAVAAASSAGAVHVFRVEYQNGFASSSSSSASSSSSSAFHGTSGSGGFGGGYGYGDEYACAGATGVHSVDASVEGAVLRVEHFNTLTESMLGMRTHTHTRARGVQRDGAVVAPSLL